jgi:hypothetical protein
MTKSNHARRRQQQRAVQDNAVDAALRYGFEIRQKGQRTAYFIGKRQVEEAQLAGEDISAFEGVAIVIGHNGTLITTVKTSHTQILKRRAK